MNTIVDYMYQHDAFSQWLGIRRIAEGEGHCTLEMEVRPEMVNGFGIAHGAMTYALADSALAFASNARGRKAVSIETSINHLKPVMAGDIITAAVSYTHLGLALTKRALNATFENNLADQLDMEEKIQTPAGKTADYHEGVSAFLEKRKANFTGK